MRPPCALALAALCLAACSKKEATAPGPRPGPMHALAEVEFSGTVESKVRGALQVFASPDPCEVDKPVKVLGMAHRALGTGNFFHEIFVPQGTLGYLCAVAIEGGKIVGVGREPHGPFKMQGQGEVVFFGKLVIEPLPAPVPIPAGLTP